MNKTIKINDIDYELIKDEKDGFDKDVVLERCTDYFNDFDYIVGDWAYNKLRLKGFYDKKNVKCSKLNNIENLDNYLKNNCAYGCRWFEIKKIKKN